MEIWEWTEESDAKRQPNYRLAEKHAPRRNTQLPTCDWHAGVPAQSEDNRHPQNAEVARSEPHPGAGIRLLLNLRHAACIHREYPERIPLGILSGPIGAKDRNPRR